MAGGIWLGHGITDGENKYLAEDGGLGPPPLPVQVHAILRSFLGIGGFMATEGYS